MLQIRTDKSEGLVMTPCIASHLSSLFSHAAGNLAPYFRLEPAPAAVPEPWLSNMQSYFSPEPHRIMLTIDDACDRRAYPAAHEIGHFLSWLVNPELIIQAQEDPEAHHLAELVADYSALVYMRAGKEAALQAASGIEKELQAMGSETLYAVMEFMQAYGRQVHGPVSEHASPVNPKHAAAYLYKTHGPVYLTELTSSDVRKSRAILEKAGLLGTLLIDF